MEPPPARRRGPLEEPTRRLADSVTAHNQQGDLPSSTQARWKIRAEGRRHERTEFVVPLLIIRHGAAGEHYAEGQSIDLSECGVGFEAEGDLIPGEVVDLIFEVNEDTTYRRYARILYRHGPRYGAYFTKCD